MDMEIKYTSDGKKVVVLGKLNSQEQIVQEIFIVNGSEIPSGEHFVVKSLHDSPAISWKEQHLKDIDTEYNKTYKEKKEKYDSVCKNLELQINSTKEKLSFLKNVDYSESKLETLINFLSGDVKYLVVSEYSDISIIDYDVSISETNYGRFEYIRLLSIFGRTNGDIMYNLHRYSDYSGNNKEVYPCNNMEQAILKVRELFYLKLEKGLNESLIQVSKKYNIEIPNDVMERYNKDNKKRLEKDIEGIRQKEESLKNELLKYS